MSNTCFRQITIVIQLVFCLAILFPLSSTAQQLDDKIIYTDSTKELRILNSHSVENFIFLKICHDRFDCKGFITESDTTGTMLNEMDVRARIARLAPYEFEIEYKYRNSKDFIRDTVVLYCLNNSMTIAIPRDTKNGFATSPEKLEYFDFLPASTDERDVVYIVGIDDEIIFYQKKN